MPKGQTWVALAGSFVLGLNVVSLGSDVACHVHGPMCDYDYKAVRITPPSSMAVVPPNMTTIVATSS